MRRTKRIAGLAVAAGVLLWCGSLWADSIIVDGQLTSICGNGNYSTSGRDCSGGEGDAFPRLQDAIDRASAGDTIFIRAGVYRQTATITSSGTATAAIILRNYPGESPVLDGGNTLPQRADGLIAVSGAAHVRIRGLQIRNSRYFGISVEESVAVTIEVCDVGYSSHGGIVVSGGSDINVDDCDVHHNNLLGPNAWHEAVSLSGVEGFTVGNSRVFSNTEEGIDAKYGCTDGSIHNNEVFDNGGPNIYIDSSRRIDVHNNRVYGSPGQGIGLAVEYRHNPEQFNTDNIKIFNNLIYDNGCGLWFWIESGAEFFARFEDIIIVNNVIHDNNRRNWGGIYIQTAAGASFDQSVVVRNNILWENSANGGARPIRADVAVIGAATVDHNLYKSGEPYETRGDAYISTQDVRFVDAAGRDYHLQAGSPAIDAGSADAAPPEDFDGRPRPAEDVDIGAYEYGADTGAPNPPQNFRIVRY